ncbi:E3 ubiquitin-protein ligase RNF12-like [Dendrobates tinctorius]|uniref:E3 ubiquitin-protein ligase RNF12-like n=1 Tax=Dendrobates tinctorius TaxID=92724 RepID=UPI003CC95517
MARRRQASKDESWLEDVTVVCSGRKMESKDEGLHLETSLVQAPAPPAENIRRRTLQINNLPTREATSQDESQSCAICLTEYEIGEQVTELRCDHRFHQNCISAWLHSSPHCPLCRTHCFL